MRLTVPRSSRTAVTISAAMLATALLLAGCSTGTADSDLQTVADNTGFYHLKVPAAWTFRTDPGIVSVFAGETLPEEEKLTDPVLLVYLSEQPTEDPLGEMLVSLVEQRAEARAWAEGATIGDPAETQVGGRTAQRLHILATDALGVEFQADFYLLRTAGREVLMMAVAPSGQWDDFAAQVDDITSENWFWHIPDDASDESSATVETTGTD